LTPKASTTSSRVEDTLHILALKLGRLETSNWTVGVALVGWLGCDGLAEDRLVVFPVDLASFIRRSFAMDGTAVS
jgi:hypothetical protein